MLKLSLSGNTHTANNSSIMDVDKLYSDYVAEKMKNHRKRIGVESLQLKEFEINLRRCRIINGVFAVEYLEQPDQDIKLQPNFFLRTCKYSIIYYEFIHVI